jgi:hypothetical protein
VEASNSCVETLIFGSFFFIVFWQSFFSHPFSLFFLSVLLSFLFLSNWFLFLSSFVFPLLFRHCFIPVSLAHVVSALAYLNLLGTKRLGCCCCNWKFRWWHMAGMWIRNLLFPSCSTKDSVYSSTLRWWNMLLAVIDSWKVRSTDAFKISQSLVWQIWCMDLWIYSSISYFLLFCIYFIFSFSTQLLLHLLFLYTGGTSPVKGDMLVIAGATLYAISNVTEVRYFPLGKIISGLIKNKIMTYHNDSKSSYFNNWKEL